MARMDPESIDLAVIAAHLRDTVGPAVAGRVVGRTRLRDAVAQKLECSQLEAELLIDTMVGRGFLVLRRNESSDEQWTIPER